MRTGIIVMAALAALLLASPTERARAATALDAELAVFDLEIQNQKLVLQEIERQAKVRRLDYRNRMHRLLEIKERAAELERRTLAYMEYQAGWVDKAVALVAELLHDDPNDEFVLPFHGAHSLPSIARLAKEWRDRIALQQTTVALGKMEMHIAGYGLTTTAEIDASIDNLRAEILDLERAYEDATLEVWIGGIGWVKAADVIRKIKAAEQSKVDLRQSANDGTYEMMIPGVGLRTRLALDADISKLNEELGKLRASIERGDVEVKHFTLDWTTASRLRAARDRVDQAEASFRQAVEAGTYEVWMPEQGWTSGNGLKAKLREAQDRAAKVQGQIASGEYAADTFVGWITRAGAQERLRELQRQLETYPEQREATAEEIERLNIALADHARIAAFDLQGLHADQTHLQAVLDTLLALLQPEVARFASERATIDAAIEAFPAEMAVTITQMENRLAFLKQARGLFP